jgi:hypothetical protein
LFFLVSIVVVAQNGYRQQLTQPVIIVFFFRTDLYKYGLWHRLAPFPSP